MIDSGQVTAAHDEMAKEYDHLDDLWYPWLFARIHEFLAENLPPVSHCPRPRALDVGCGTGFQSFLLARAGYVVIIVRQGDARLAGSDLFCRRGSAAWSLLFRMDRETGSPARK